MKERPSFFCLFLPSARLLPLLPDPHPPAAAGLAQTRSRLLPRGFPILRARVTLAVMSTALGPVHPLTLCASSLEGPSQLSCHLLTRDGAGGGFAVDLLAPHQLLVQVDHLGEVVVGLQDFRWKRQRGDARLKECGGLWVAEASTHDYPALCSGGGASFLYCPDSGPTISLSPAPPLVPPPRCLAAP